MKANKQRVSAPVHQTIARVARLAALAGALAASACSEQQDLPADIRVQNEPIIHGKNSTAKQNAVVLLRVGEDALCSATLVAPDLILTARHCVSETDESVRCSASGHALSGGRIHADRAPEELVVYTGSSISALQARARGASIVHDSARNLCNHDIAFVVLDRPVTGVPIAPLRLDDKATHVGDKVTAIGWGITQTGDLPTARQQRASVSILDVGPSRGTASNQLVVGEAICSGDSGGPAIAADGSIVGVVSSGGNGQYSSDNPVASCLGAETRNVYTRVAAFPKLVQEAFAEVGAEPRIAKR